MSIIIEDIIHAPMKLITMFLQLPCFGLGLRMADNPMLTSAGPKTPRLIKGLRITLPSSTSG